MSTPVIDHQKEAGEESKKASSTKPGGEPASVTDESTLLSDWLLTLHMEEAVEPLKQAGYKTVGNLVILFEEGRLDEELKVLKKATRDPIKRAVASFCKQHPPEKDPEAEKRQQQLENAIQAVTKLQEGALAKAKGAEKEGKEEAVRLVAEVVKVLGDAKGTPPDPDKVYEFASGQLNQWMTNLESAKNGIKLNKRQLTPEQLITKLGLLCGVTVDANGARTRSDIPKRLLQMPENATIEDPSMPLEDVDSEFSEAGMERAFATTMETIGSSFALNTQAHVSMFVGCGIAAVSAAFEYSNAREAQRQAKQRHSSVRTRRCITKYSFAPLCLLRLGDGDTVFSHSAEADVQQISKQGDPSEQRRMVNAFYQEYGTHFFRNVMLGGWYKYTASASAYESEWTQENMNKFSDVSKDAFSLAASYAGLGGSARASVAGSASTDKVEAKITGDDGSSKNLNIDISTKVLGGTPGLPFPLWRQCLEFNDNWRVIYGEAITPVWEFIRKRDGKLGELFERVWVQDIFIASLPNDLRGKFTSTEKVGDLQSKLEDSLKELKKNVPVTDRSSSKTPTFGTGTGSSFDDNPHLDVAGITEIEVHYDDQERNNGIRSLKVVYRLKDGREFTALHGEADATPTLKAGGFKLEDNEKITGVLLGLSSACGSPAVDYLSFFTVKNDDIRTLKKHGPYGRHEYVMLYEKPTKPVTYDALPGKEYLILSPNILAFYGEQTSHWLGALGFYGEDPIITAGGHEPQDTDTLTPQKYHISTAYGGGTTRR